MVRVLVMHGPRGEKFAESVCYFVLEQFHACAQYFNYENVTVAVDYQSRKAVRFAETQAAVQFKSHILSVFQCRRYSFLYEIIARQRRAESKQPYRYKTARIKKSGAGRLAVRVKHCAYCAGRDGCVHVFQFVGKNPRMPCLSSPYGRTLQF